MKSIFPERINALYFAKSIQNIPNVDIWVNSAFSHDIKNQLSYFVDFIADNPNDVDNKKFRIFIYNDKLSMHNPLGKNDTIKIIKNAFDNDL